MDGHNFLMRRPLLRHQWRLQSGTTSRTRQRTAETLYLYFSHVKPSLLHKSTSQSYSNSAGSQSTNHIAARTIHSPASGLSPPCVTQTISNLRITPVSFERRTADCMQDHCNTASLYSTRRYEYKRTRNHDNRFHCFTVHFVSLSFIYTNVCTCF